MAGVSSDGLKTTVLPSSRLGPSIHSGTAKGKFHGVMTATTPHGLRRMKASFSAISEASTSPIGMRPVPKTYWIMCRPSIDLGPALGDDLAALAGHQLGEVVGLALDELGEVVEQLGAMNAAGAPPGGIGGARGGDGPLRFLGVASGKDADDLALAGGAAALEAFAVGRLPAAGDEVPSGEGGGHGAAPPERW